MSPRLPVRPGAAGAAAVFVVAAGLQIALTAEPGLGDGPGVLATTLAVLGVPVLIGCLVGWRAPESPVGAALAWVGAAPTAVFAVELWGESDLTGHAWPGAHVLYVVQLGAWVWNLAGFAALCLVFPSGLLPGRRWRVVVWLIIATAVLVHTVVSLGGGGIVRLPVLVESVLTALAFAALLSALGATIAALVVRHRHGDEITRLRLRWLMLGALTVPVLLAVGWALQALGQPPAVAYTGFLLAMLIAVPAAVAVAVLRYDLFDVDRLLGESLAWLLTSVISAGIFAAVVFVAASFGADSRFGVTGAAFVTALALLPTHRRLTGLVARLVDRDRVVVQARMRRFVQEVRDGEAEPESAEEVLRAVLVDPRLRLLIRLPGDADGGYVDLAGAPATPEPGRTTIALRIGAAEVGLLVLGTASPRRMRRARDVATQARLPIEVSRLRLQLRAALTDARSSRTRLLVASVEEARRLERDLHDGAQQQIVAVGMRLRSLQRRFPPEAAEHIDLDAAVGALEATIAELRRLAHGLRPSRLDDGLPAALRTLVGASPVTVRLSVSDVRISELLATTAYFVVAEAYANALKHARAGVVTIDVNEVDDVLHVAVCDDGIGGAAGGLTSMRDRVASVGGRLSVLSPTGGGTRVTVEIPCAS